LKARKWFNGVATLEQISQFAVPSKRLKTFV